MELIIVIIKNLKVIGDGGIYYIFVELINLYSFC